MSKFKFYLLVFCVGGAFLARVQAEPPPSEDQRKTLLILSSVGGGGHIAACNTLKQLVGEEYNIEVIYPINQLRVWGVPSCEEFYNGMLKRGWIRPMNFLVRHVVPKIFRSYRKKMEKIITAHIQKVQPHMVISLIPFINYPASEAARKVGLPFLLITTDNDLRNWALDLHKATHPHMKITIGEELQHTKELLLHKNLPAYVIETTGLPLRSEFRSQKDKEKICEAFELSLDKKKVLIMMGGAGSVMAHEYAKRIGSMPLGVNLIVIAGKNTKLKKELERMEIDPTNTLSVFGFTDRVADLMAVSDLVITKPGPGTINEAMAMRLPMLIDNTNISLFWERANVDMVLKYGIGQKIRRLSQLEEVLTHYLQEEADPSFCDVPANQFHLRVPEIIRTMIAENDRYFNTGSLE